MIISVGKGFMLGVPLSLSLSLSLQELERKKNVLVICHQVWLCKLVWGVHLAMKNALC